MFGMSRRRLTLGSLAAATATMCVLSLVPPGASTAHGFVDLPIAQATYCVTSSAHALPAAGTDRPVAMFRVRDRLLGCSGGGDAETGAQVEGLAAGKVLIAAPAGSGETVGALARAPAASSSYRVPPRSSRGPEPARGEAPRGDSDHLIAAAENDTASKPDPSDTKPKIPAAPPAGDDGTDFSDSAKPAGPNLSTKEEKAIIENNWQ